LSQTKVKSRLSWVDISKGIAIILVAFRHILIGIQRADIEIEQYLLDLNEIVYSFRMPLFFILSGIFFSKSVAKRSNREFITYKVRSLLYPYVVWCLIQVSLQVVLSNYTNANRGWMDYVYIVLQPRAIDQMWFLYALFNVTAFYFVLKYLLNFNKVALTITSMVAFGCSIFVKEYSLIHDLLFYMIFFLAGDLISRTMLTSNFQDKFGSWKTVLIMLPIFVISQWLWLNSSDGEWDDNIAIYGSVALFGSFFTIAVSQLIAPLGITGFIERVGRNSLQIYVMHVLVCSAFRILLTKVFGIENTYVLLFILLTAGITIPLYIVSLGKKFPVINLLFSPSGKKR